MFARIDDSQGNIVASVSWQVVPSETGKYLDRFVDDAGHVYLERPHHDVIDGEELLQCLRNGADKFYHLQELKVYVGLAA